MLAWLIITSGHYFRITMQDFVGAKKVLISYMWWHMPAISTPQSEFEANLSYAANSKAVCATW
jgi:hypothetical protein